METPSTEVRGSKLVWLLTFFVQNCLIGRSVDQRANCGSDEDEEEDGHGGERGKGQHRPDQVRPWQPASLRDRPPWRVVGAATTANADPARDVCSAAQAIGSSSTAAPLAL
jgi:hypothetical protein